MTQRGQEQVLRAAKAQLEETARVLKNLPAPQNREERRRQERGLRRVKKHLATMEAAYQRMLSSEEDSR